MNFYSEQDKNQEVVSLDQPSAADRPPAWLLTPLSRRLVLLGGGFLATAFTTSLLGRKEIVIAQDHPLYSSQVKIYTQGGYRYIISNGIPNHQTGAFPNAHNPNAIQPQRYQFRVPLNPQVAAQITWRRLGRFGIALNGVLFDPGAAEFWNGDRNWQYEALTGHLNLGMDSNNAHVQPGGSYHYHGLPIGLIAKLGGGTRMLLIGYAADGFPVYSPYGYTDPKNARSPIKKIRSSYRLKSGQRNGGPGGTYDGTFGQDFAYIPGAGDLDECNGRFGVTSEYPKGIYHYYITASYPFIPRAFRGTPDSSFRPGPEPGARQGPGRGPGQGGPPPNGQYPPFPPGQQPPFPPGQYPSFPPGQPPSFPPPR